MTIISRGQNVLYTPIQNTDDDEESISIRRFTPTKDKDVFEKAVDQTITYQATINNLEDFITDYLEEPYFVEVNNQDLRRSDKYVDVDIPNTNKRIKYVFKKGAMKTAFALFDKNTGRSNGFKLENMNKMFCSWGWFEDVILNSFFKTTVKDKDGEEHPFMEIRSVHSPYRYELSEEEKKSVTFKKSDDDNPTPTDIINSDELISNRCNNNPGLYSLGFDSIILPGQWFSFAGNTRNIIERDLNNKKNFEGGSRINEKTNENIKITKSDRKDLEDRVNTITYFETLDKIINDNFKPFGKPNEFYGNIRNMVFSVDFIKSHFQNTSTPEEGLRSLWSDVSAKYGGFFAFMIHSDTKNNGRIGICDRKYMNPTEKNAELLREPLNFEKYIEGKKELGSSERLMEFSVFSKDSIITSYNLNLQLTKEAATLALYGNQGKLANGSFTNSSTLYDEGIQKFGALQNAIFSEFKGSGKIKLGKDKSYVDPIAITGFSSPSDDGTGLDMVEYNKDSNFIDKLDIENKASIGFDDILSITQDFKKIKEEINKKLKPEGDEEGENEVPPTPLDEAYPLNYDRKGALADDLKKRYTTRVNHSTIESDQSDWTIQKPIIPIDLDLTIDGIGGLVPGNLFKIDFLPEIYRKYTYFIIMSINHSITTSGWSTSINAKMKLDFPKMIKNGLIKTDDD
jgi:hypothetical protein